MSDKKIKDLVIDDTVTGFFLVRRKTVREYYRGQYLSLELGDSTGRIQAVWWEPDQFALNELEEGMVVKSKITIGEYKNQKQARIERIRLAQDDEYKLEQILAHSSQTKEHRRSRILALTEKIENSYVKQLALKFWDDEEFFEKFLNAAAGKLWHHAYIGGLSEHSANVGELVLRVASGYDFLDSDILTFGGLLHDVGKVQQYTEGPVLDYTDEGRLIGHICLADVWICERAATIENFPEKLLMKLRHLILSHQGELEYSTPVVPQIPEAFVLYYCDEIDSKMGAIDRIRQRQDKSGWSEYVKLLGRFLYFDKSAEE